MLIDLRPKSERSNFALMIRNGIYAGLEYDSIAITLHLGNCTRLTSVDTLLAIVLLLLDGWQNVIIFSVELI